MTTINARESAGPRATFRDRRRVERGSASFLFKALLTVAVGTALGLWATHAALERGFLFGTVTNGPWVAFPTVGSPAIDPYARAVLAQSALAPIGADEGLAFFATRDSEGGLLTARCDYSVETGDIPGRFWSLAVFDRDGHVADNNAGRYGVTSQEVVRIDGHAPVMVAPGVRAGNWLPSPTAGPFTLVLSLYEPNSGTAAAAATDAALPGVRRGTCRS